MKSVLPRTPVVYLRLPDGGGWGWGVGMRQRGESSRGPQAGCLLVGSLQHAAPGADRPTARTLLTRQISSNLIWSHFIQTIIS